MNTKIENSKMRRNKLSRGVLTATAKHFGITRQALTHRLYKLYDEKTIDYVLELDTEIKKKKSKAKNKIKKYITISEPA